MNYSIETGKAATFRYRILIVSGTARSDELNRQAQKFETEK